MLQNKVFSKDSIPTVVLVGRPNVGKSALFNKLADKKRALVYDVEGVTRDPIVDTVSWGSCLYRLVDTAGIFESLSKRDLLTQEGVKKSFSYLDKADIILFVVDGSVGYTEEDIRILEYAKKKRKPLFVVVNKSDLKLTQELISQGYYDGDEYEKVFLSAIHRKNIEGLQKQISTVLKKESDGGEEAETPYFFVTFLGKPNVGKSSIMNILTRSQSSFVSSVPGTTREAVSFGLEDSSFAITLTDTAGVRRKKSVSSRLEELMVSNTIRSIECSHIVIMVFDASEERLADQDLQLVMKAFNDYNKAVLVIWNKIDLVKTKNIKRYVNEKIDLYQYFFRNIPQVYFSAKQMKDGKQIIHEIKKLWMRYSQVYDSKEIQLLLKEALAKKSIVKSKQILTFQYAYVAKTKPLSIIISSRQKEYFTESTLLFLKNEIRKKKKLLGVPIKIGLKK
jgi:GTP-binding protein